MTTAPLSYLLILILALLKGTSSMAEPSEGSGLRKLQLHQDDDDDYGYDDGDVAFSHNSQPPPYCDAVTCGGVYTDKVFLNDDLLCGGDINDGTAQDLNCALTLDGHGAELDCNGYTIYETTSSDDSDSARNCQFPPRFIKRQAGKVKNECGMYYLQGVCLINGATLKNCGVQKFFYGVRVQNSATIEHSTIKLNSMGVRVNDDQAGDKTAISYT